MGNDIKKIGFSHNNKWDKQLGEALRSFLITSGITALPLIMRGAGTYFAGNKWNEVFEAAFGNIDIFIVIVSIMASVLVVRCVTQQRRSLFEFVFWGTTLVCGSIAVISLVQYCSKAHTDVLSVSRAIKWFIIAISCSVAKLMASYYIPLNERKD